MGNSTQISRCESCGAPLNVDKAVGNVVECEFCFTKNLLTKPNVDEDTRRNLDIAENELNVGRFDAAYSAFEKAAERYKDEPKAYFGMALAEFKVRYLKDTEKADDGSEKTKLRPICYKVVKDRFLDNKNYKAALKCATPQQQEEYIKRAEEIDNIRAEFYRLEKAGLDYDTFICVKVHDENDNFTDDSAYAHRIHRALTSKGYKPFYSEIDIKGAVGEKYEAHILHAIVTSETMLVVCSDKDYLTTPWVKNEYTRFLQLMRSDSKTRAITIVFNGTPVEELPGNDGKIQGIDRSLFNADSLVLSFVESHSPLFLEEQAKKAEKQRQEEERRKREEEERRKAAEAQQKELAEQLKAMQESQAQFEKRQKEMLSAQSAKSTTGPATATDQTLLMRGHQALEVDNIDDAIGYYNRVLDMDPQNPAAWYGLLLCEFLSTSDKELLAKINKASFTDNSILFEVMASGNYKYAKDYADPEIEGRLVAIEQAIDDQKRQLSRTVSPNGMAFYEKMYAEGDGDNKANAMYSGFLAEFNCDNYGQLIEQINQTSLTDYNLLFDLQSSTGYKRAKECADSTITEYLSDIDQAIANRKAKLSRTVAEEGLSYYRKIYEDGDKDNAAQAYYSRFLASYECATAEDLISNINDVNIDDTKYFHLLFDIGDNVDFMAAASNGNEETAACLNDIFQGAAARVSELVRSVDADGKQFYDIVLERKTNLSLDYMYARFAEFLLDNNQRSAQDFADSINNLKARFDNFEHLFDIRSQIKNIVDNVKEKKKVVEFECSKGANAKAAQKEYDSIINDYNLVDSACVNKISAIKSAEPDAFKKQIETTEAKIEKLKGDVESHKQKRKAEAETVAPIKKKQDKLKRKVKNIDTDTVVAGAYELWETYEDVPGVFAPVPRLFGAVGGVGEGFDAVWEWVGDHDIDAIYPVCIALGVIATIILGFVFVGLLFLALAFAVACSFIFAAITVGYVAITIVVSVVWIFEKAIRLILLLRDNILEGKIAKLEGTINTHDSAIRKEDNSINNLNEQIKDAYRAIEQLNMNISMLENA